MAYRHVFIILAIIFPVSICAKDFIVGDDDKGWTINFDYQKWAQDKKFHVGDRLVFKYPSGVHNVFKVNGTAFQNCSKPPLDEALTSGNDVIVLATQGRKWYICGVGDHCAVGGQKLFIVVNPGATPPSVAPSQSFAAPAQALPYTNSAHGTEVTLMAVALAIFLVVAV